MLPKWKMPKGKYILKIRNKNEYLLKSGYWENDDGSSRTEAQTTPSMWNAIGFDTVSRAETVRVNLRETYGLETQIMERKVSRNAC